jgi:hypothetical protein
LGLYNSQVIFADDLHVETTYEFSGTSIIDKKIAIDKTGQISGSTGLAKMCFGLSQSNPSLSFLA